MAVWGKREIMGWADDDGGEETSETERARETRDREGASARERCMQIGRKGRSDLTVARKTWR